MFPDDLWAEHAACRGLPGDLMVPADQATVEEAKKVCARCPVTDLCLEHALATNEQHGVWGGKSERERVAIRRERRAAS
jgi:WhiB family redox-sensing transcriptional regulator